MLISGMVILGEVRREPDRPRNGCRSQMSAAAADPSMRGLRPHDTALPQFGHRKLRADSVSRIIIAQANTGHAMHAREPSSPDSIWSMDVADGRLPEQPAGLWDLSSTNHDAALLLREPFADRAGTVILAATALAATFVLGWAGGANWHEFVPASSPTPVARKEAPQPHIAETRPSGRSEATRRTGSNPDPVVT